MSFTRKRIDVTIELGTGQFGDTGSNKVTLTGLRVMADVQCYGGESMPQSQVRIYGLPLSMINQLTTVGPVNAAIMLKNSMLIAAGDDENGMKVVYSGTIQSAYGDFRAMPEVPLNVMAVAGLADAVKPVNASSFTGAADVATIMKGFADAMGVQFENNGVNVKLSNPYFPGTTMMQVKACARAAHINCTLDRGVLAIWPKGAARAAPSVPVLSPKNGTVGYPAFSSNGIEIDCEFNSDLAVGAPFTVESSLTVAQGTWTAIQVVHSLDAEVPNGRWFTHVTGIPVYAN